jgi:hypothetical protein
MLARQDGFDDARNLALKIDSIEEGQRGTALRTVALLQAKKQGPAATQRWAAVLEDARDRAYALLGIAQALLGFDDLSCPIARFRFTENTGRKRAHSPIFRSTLKQRGAPLPKDDVSNQDRDFKFEDPEVPERRFPKLSPEPHSLEQVLQILKHFRTHYPSLQRNANSLSALTLGPVRENRFDVDDWCAIDCF